MLSNKRKTRRLLNDIKLVKTSPLEGIWIDWENDAQNMDKAFSTVIGPDDTPYEGGFYTFDFDFSTNYPFVPPKVTYKTTGAQTPQLTKFIGCNNNAKTVRFNPNLYKCGKVCISFLGTWSGPTWVACLNIQSMSVSFRSLLQENPIRNEPGYDKEKVNGPTNILYNYMLAHANIRVAVLDMIRNTPPKYKCFRPNMIQHFLKNYDKYIAFCTKHSLSHWNGTLLKFRVYGWQEYVDFKLLKKELEKLKQELIVEKLELEKLKLENDLKTLKSKEKQETLKIEPNKLEYLKIDNLEILKIEPNIITKST
jgi:ubiquitin-conjugating enzyme E2 Z